MPEFSNPQLIRCRILAVGPFVINVAAQLYGMLAKPNIKDIADANHYAFSPNPFFIAGFFALQLVLQLYWIRNLFVWRLSPSKPGYDHRISLPHGWDNFDPATLEPPASTTEVQPAQVAYVPIFALGNLCIAGWMLLWRREQFVASEVLCIINAALQLYAVFYLLAPCTPFALAKGNVSTHLVARTFAGIAVLDVLDNGAVALRYGAPPSVPVQALTVVLLALFVRFRCMRLVFDF
ncbi:hypothetical protein CONPUDRAFT_44976 [Coniophora puteana RWD-64-598 SS2]|uniref:Uncharacterized protein n=1 Tax=Coniophora puteana (strain RWD-64-598) TaxID=741705 RepID=A0A5M3N7H5_CONPW|nr:uncharacterized protein CONPUDRAFT_44976 [Coniophora puteana RWD-64-598 SS2]EIW87238.1 hypothetical protein CONPUDRAFT_44976 [Coniophora puteana RWD-64-598 SS2]